MVRGGGEAAASSVTMSRAPAISDRREQHPWRRSLARWLHGRHPGRGGDKRRRTGSAGQLAGGDPPPRRWWGGLRTGQPHRATHTRKRPKSTDNEHGATGAGSAATGRARRDMRPHTSESRPDQRPNYGEHLRRASVRWAHQEAVRARRDGATAYRRPSPHRDNAKNTGNPARL